MARSLQNPNDRRRINAITRAVAKGKFPSASAGVAAWLKNRKNAAFARQKPTKELKSMSKPERKAFYASLPKGVGPKKYAQIRRAVAQQFAVQADGYNPSRSGPVGRKRKYSSRALAPKASRYLKRSGDHSKVKVVPLATKKGEVMMTVVDADALEFWAGKKVQSREAHGGRRPKRAPRKSKGKKRASSKKTAKGRKSKGGKKGQLPKGLAAYAELKRTARNLGLSTKGTMAELSARVGATGVAVQNGLALTNPSVNGLTSYLTGYALPIAIGGAAGGAVHAAAAGFGVTEKMQEYVEMVPAVGPWLAENAPYTMQGLVAGTILAAAAPFASRVSPMATRYLGLTAGAAIVFGAGLDAFNAVASRYGEEGDDDLSDLSDEELAALEAEGLEGLALDNISALGGLALDNLGGLALDNLCDGFAYETAPLTAASPLEGTYGQASLGDADMAGDDFSTYEGVALANGQQAWFASFGLPPRLISRQASSRSHFAGRHGHRWGWLIQALGWERASAVARLPAAQRVAFIRKLKAAASAAFQKQMMEARAIEAEATLPAPELAPAAGVAPVGATSTSGSTNYLGEPALFSLHNN